MFVFAWLTLLGMIISRSIHAVTNDIFLLWRALLHIYSRSVTQHTDTHKTVPLNFALSGTVVTNHVWHWALEMWLIWTEMHTKCYICPLGFRQSVRRWGRKISHSWSHVVYRLESYFGWKVKVKSLSRVRLFGTPWTVVHQVPPSVGFPRQEYWSGLPCPSPGDLPNSGIEPRSPALLADILPISKVK